MPTYSSWVSYNWQTRAKRMLSPYMSKTFLSILAVPNKTDFCIIPTFKCVHPSTEALANAPQSSYNHCYNLNLFQRPKPFQLSIQILIFFNLFDFLLMYPTIIWYSNISDDA